MSRLALGTDVSSYQDVQGCDYELAADVGEDFCIVRISAGEDVSKGGLEHLAKLLQLRSRPTRRQVEPGVYHFARLKKGGWKRPEEQAEAFVQAIRESGWNPPQELLEGSGIPALWLDIEWQSFRDKAAGRLFRRKVTSERIRDFCLDFLGHAGTALGAPIGIYTGPSFIRYRLKYWPGLALFPLWLAKYTRNRFTREQIPGSGEWPSAIELEDGRRVEACVWQWIGSAGRVIWYKPKRWGVGAIDRNLARVG
jgi:GH25 family lysozyme M1 (1,4-beta-N-acetylmuramidase)